MKKAQWTTAQAAWAWGLPKTCKPGAANGHDKNLRIVLCGHAGEHDALLQHGWHLRTWTARKGYALTEEAMQNSKDETLWCSPHCVPVVPELDLFSAMG